MTLCQGLLHLFLSFDQSQLIDDQPAPWLARRRAKVQHGVFQENAMTASADPPVPPEGEIARLVDEQLELAVAKLPVMPSVERHPSPIDHDELATAHASLEDLLLGNAQASPEVLDELEALQSAPALSDEELARQALALGGDGEVAPPR
jgi:hypothetical protein